MRTSVHSFTPERSRCTRYFYETHNSGSRRIWKRKVARYWEEVFKSPYPTKLDPDLIYLKIGYELQIRALDSEEREISSLLWDRYDAVRKASRMTDVPEDIRILIQLNRNQKENEKETTKMAKVRKPAAATEDKTATEEVQGKRRNAVGKSGMSRIDTYKYLFEKNYKAKKTDVELAEAMCEEFPQLKTYNEKDIKMHRSYFNSGHLGDMTSPPDKPLPEYDEEGSPIFRKRGRQREAAQAVGETITKPKTSKKVPSASTTTKKIPTKKVVKKK